MPHSPPRIKIEDRVVTSPKHIGAAPIRAKVIDYFDDGKDCSSMPQHQRILILLLPDGQKIFRREDDCVIDNTPDVPRII